MKVTVNNDEVSKDLDNKISNIETAFKNMVAQFSGKVIETSSQLTRKGSQESIEIGQTLAEGPEKNYFNLYRLRAIRYGIPVEAGYHKGAWQISDSSTFNFNPEIRNPEDNTERTINLINYEWTIGTDFWLGAKGPALSMLNDADNPRNHTGYALHDEIEETILAIYSSGAELKDYFDEGLIR